MYDNFGAVIVAGGSGSRFGSNKLLEIIDDKPVFIHSILAFLDVCRQENIVFVGHKSYLEQYRNLVHRFILDCMINFEIGGETRADSVIHGIKTLSDNLKFVAIHDAARPLIQSSVIMDCFKSCIANGNGVVAAKINDTIKLTNNNAAVERTVDRTNLWAVQTPQTFRLKELRNAYEKVKADGVIVTDDAGAMEYAGYKVYLVENKTPNIKITYPNDIEIAKLLIKTQKLN